MAVARKRKERSARQTPKRSGWWRYALGALVLLYLGFQVYAPTLDSPFLFDDEYLPFASADSAAQPLNLWLAGVRPALMFGYWLNYRVAEHDPFWYHVVNVILHVLNAGLVFFIVRKVLELAGEGERRGLLALFAAALFLLHPVQTESVAYVASRSENQTGLFFFAALAAFLYRGGGAVGWRRAALILVLFLAALTTKEHAISLPALLLLTDYFWNPGFRFEGIRRNWRLYVPLLVGGGASAVFVATRVMASSLSAGFHLKEVSWQQYLFTQFRVFFDYLRLFALPVNQTADYDYPFARTIFDRGAIAWLILLLMCLGAAWAYRRRYPLAAFGLFTVVLLLAPTSSVLPIRDPIAERRMYLPMIGYLFLLLELLRRLRIAQAVLASGMAVLLLGAAAAAYARNTVWSGPIAFWEDTVRKAPDKRRPRFQLAFAYYQAGRCAEASEEYGRAARLEPPDYELLVDWALAYDCLQQFDEAMAKLRLAAAREPGAHVYSLIGMIYAKQGRWEQSLEALAAAEKLDPGYTMALLYRGNVYLATGRPAQALAEYQRVLALDPRNQLAAEGMARARQALAAAPR